MVSQKLISLKLDIDLIDSLDQWCDHFNVKRNKLINDLVRSMLADPSTYEINCLIAYHAPHLLSFWYKKEFGLDISED